MEALTSSELVAIVEDGGYIAKAKVEKDIQLLSGYHKKVMHAIAVNVMLLVEKYGIENCIFLTLTFKDHVTDPKEAEKRFHSLERHVLAVENGRYLDWLAVIQRHKSGRIHYHVLLACKENMRGELNFAELEKKNYQSANKALRSEWAYWRKVGPKYRFGRVEALPVKTCSDAIARYVSKYISKHIDRRLQEDKGIRVWKCSRGARKAGVRWMWESKRTAIWRAAVGRFAKAHGIRTLDALAREFGPRWAYHWGAHIMDRYGSEDVTREVDYPGRGMSSPDPEFIEGRDWDPEERWEVHNPDYEANLAKFLGPSGHSAECWREIRLQNVRDLVKKGSV